MIIVKILLALVVYFASLAKEAKNSVKWLEKLPNWIPRVVLPIALISAVFVQDIIETLSPKPLTLAEYTGASAGPNAGIDTTKNEVRELTQWLKDSLPRIQYDRLTEERLKQAKSEDFSFAYGVAIQRIESLDFRGGLAALEIALKFSRHRRDTVTVHTAVSASFLSLGVFDSATHSLDVGLSLDSTDGALWNNRAVLMELAGRENEALLCYGKAIQFSMSDYTAYLNRGMLLEKQRKYGAAEEDYKAATRANDKAAVAWNNLGAIEGRLGNYSKALPLLRRAIEADSSYALAWFNLGTTLSKTGDTKLAIVYLEKSCRLNPGHLNSWFNLGVQYRANAEFDKAAQAFSVCVTLDPNNKFAQNSLGEAFLQLQRFGEALVHLNKAISLDTTYCGAWVNRATALLMTNNCDSLVIAAQRAVRCNSQDAAAWQMLAAAKYVCSDDLQGADSAVTIALRIKPGMTQALRLRSDIAADRARRRAK